MSTEPVNGKEAEYAQLVEYYVCQVVDRKIVVYAPLDAKRTYKRMTSTPMPAAEFAGFTDMAAFEDNYYIVHASDGLVDGNTLSRAEIVMQISDTVAKRIMGMALTVEQSQEIQKQIEEQKQKSNKSL